MSISTPDSKLKSSLTEEKMNSPFPKFEPSFAMQSSSVVQLNLWSVWQTREE